MFGDLTELDKQEQADDEAAAREAAYGVVVDDVVPQFDEADDEEEEAIAADPLNRDANPEQLRTLRNDVAQELKRVRSIKASKSRQKLEELLVKGPKWMDEDYKIKAVSHQVQLSRGICTYHLRRPIVTVPDSVRLVDEERAKDMYEERRQRYMRRLDSKMHLSTARAQQQPLNMLVDADLEEYERQLEDEDLNTSSSTSYMTGDSEPTDDEVREKLGRVDAPELLSAAERARLRARKRRLKAAARRVRIKEEDERRERERLAAEERRRQQDDIKRLAEHRERITQALREKEEKRKREEEKRRADAKKKKRGRFAAIGDDLDQDDLALGDDGDDEAEAPGDGGRLRGGAPRKKRRSRRRGSNASAASARAEAADREDRAEAEAESKAREDRRRAKRMARLDEELAKLDEEAAAGDEGKERFEEGFRDNFARRKELPPNVMVVPTRERNKFEERRRIQLPPRNPLVRLPPRQPLVQPGTEDLVVLLHSSTGYSYEFHELGTALVRKGFTVLSFDFYGRGGSPWPSGRWNRKLECTLDLLLEQTDELLVHLGYVDARPDDSLPEGRHVVRPFTFTMLGFDMGADVAVAYADLRPRSVEKLVLMAPLGVPRPMSCADCLTRMMLCCRTDSWLMGSQGENFHDRVRCAAFIDRLEEEVTWQVNHTRGYQRAVDSTLQFFPRRSMGTIYRAVGHDRIRRPTLAFIAGDDRWAPLGDGEALLDVMPQAKVKVVDATGHHLMWEGFEDVTPRIVEFLKGREYRRRKKRQRKQAREAGQTGSALSLAQSAADQGDESSVYEEDMTEIKEAAKRNKRPDGEEDEDAESKEAAASSRLVASLGHDIHEAAENEARRVTEAARRRLPRQAESGIEITAEEVLDDYRQRPPERSRSKSVLARGEDEALADTDDELSPSEDEDLAQLANAETEEERRDRMAEDMLVLGDDDTRDDDERQAEELEFVRRRLSREERDLAERRRRVFGEPREEQDEEEDEQDEDDA